MMLANSKFNIKIYFFIESGNVNILFAETIFFHFWANLDFSYVPCPALHFHTQPAWPTSWLQLLLYFWAFLRPSFTTMYTLEIFIHHFLFRSYGVKLASGPETLISFCVTPAASITSFIAWLCSTVCFCLTWWKRFVFSSFTSFSFYSFISPKIHEWPFLSYAFPLFSVCDHIWPTEIFILKL